jgi:hypothetical protein
MHSASDQRSFRYERYLTGAQRATVRTACGFSTGVFCAQAGPRAQKAPQAHQLFFVEPTVDQDPSQF